MGSSKCLPPSQLFMVYNHHGDTGLGNGRKRVPGIVPWLGGKGRAVSKIAPLIPESRIYCEPYGGAASILLNISPRDVEIYNDIDPKLINLMQVMKDPYMFERLKRRLYFTPYALDEYKLSIRLIEDPDASPEDLAWAFYVGQTQGFGGTIMKTDGNWGRSFITSCGMATTVSTWFSRLSNLDVWHQRLQGVSIESRDGIDVIRDYDSEETTFYVDPPYVLSTRAWHDEGRRSYIKEPDDDYHRELVDVLLSCRGAVVLSCYDNDIYKPLHHNGWDKIQWNTTSSVAGRKRGSKFRGAGAALRSAPRVETVYRNPRALAMMRDHQTRCGAEHR